MVLEAQFLLLLTILNLDAIITGKYVICTDNLIFWEKWSVGDNDGLLEHRDKECIKNCGVETWKMSTW
jgi:hypothetical protein